jgi:GH25 family lysozyme M1 (1,4-beta-N-acetylmuramidase)
VKGIDISAWQENIDWDAVKAAGAEFAIIKLGQNNRVDSMFYEHVQNALLAGMKVGVYVYSVATSIEDAQNEADFVHYQLSGLTPDMGIWFDAEDERMEGNDITAICAAFVERLKAYQHNYIGVYSSYNWLTNGNIDPATLDCPIWCAQYNSECNYEGSNLHFWQFTDSWEIAGQNFDGNIYFGM